MAKKTIKVPKPSKPKPRIIRKSGGGGGGCKK